MLYYISGASASGKKTVVYEVAKRLPNMEGYHDNDHGEKYDWDRFRALDYWIDYALDLERSGVDLIIGGQSPLGEVLAAPRAVEVEGIAPCLLDCHDFVRLERFVKRESVHGVHPDMDTFVWAVYHRMHARDPQWRQDVCTSREHPTSEWSRWLGWKRGDPRWTVPVFDNTNETLEDTLSKVISWIESVREQGAPLMREAAWWE